MTKKLWNCDQRSKFILTLFEKLCRRKLVWEHFVWGTLYEKIHPKNGRKYVLKLYAFLAVPPDWTTLQMNLPTSDFLWQSIGSSVIKFCNSSNWTSGMSLAASSHCMPHPSSLQTREAGWHHCIRVLVSSHMFFSSLDRHPQSHLDSGNKM